MSRRGGRKAGPKSKTKKSAGDPDTSQNGHGLAAGDAAGDEGGEGNPLPNGIPEKQDPSERRLIRHEYRKVIDEIRENQEDLANPANNMLQVKLERTDEIFQNVKMTREAALDSQALVYISDLGKKKAQALQADGNFQPIEFSNKLVQFLTGQANMADGTSARISRSGWIDLGKAVQPFFKRSPPLRFMFGAFEWDEPQQRAKKERKKKVDDGSKNAKELQPETVERRDQLEKREETTEAVEMVLSRLKEIYKDYSRSPICFIEFVTNPHSFGQTIENIFHVSFLVRDGHARVTYDDDRLPVIEPVEKEPGQEEPANQKRHQCILSLTKTEWREMIKTFEITEAIIPHRPSPGPSASRYT